MADGRQDGKQPFAIARQDGETAGLRRAMGGVALPGRRGAADLHDPDHAEPTPRWPGLHERMPVILEPGDLAGVARRGRRRCLALLRPAREDVLHLWPVSRTVNSVRNNGAELLDRIDDPHAPAAE